ncbi:MAG TPA: HDIG domain-containing protein [Thermotogota bacterium]|nr:HDIG domain-containing protein [Thermotogota bacterium]HRW91784.1 HDIG domain-containing protein [Thermotogota bacterium]
MRALEKWGGKVSPAWRSLLAFMEQKWLLFGLACLLSFFTTLFFWQLSIPVFLFLWVLFFLAEMLICEGTFARNRFFRMHRSFSTTFYVLLFSACFLNLVLTFYLNSSYASIFFGVSLLTVLFGKKVGQGSSVFLTLHFLACFPQRVAPGMILLLAGFLTASFSNHVNKRLDISLAAFYVSLLKAFTALLLGYTPFDRFFVNQFVAFAVTPLVSTIAVIGFLPYVEWTSRVFSNIGMMELGNLNHPLLKKLFEEAPGTYFHSMTMANLSENAAERIGVNPTLARVGSYFHDVGKLWKPQFFTENQQGENPHDLIEPSMSKLVLNEHVKHGVTLAKEYKLPILFEDLIVQHHGTRVQKFFYHKAKTENDAVSEDQFRYAGPKPQFKEAGIIMLADSCEAAVKSLKEPGPGKVQEVVKQIVDGIYTERQLDDSGLTLKDLESIVDEFSRSLLNAMRKRIAYPTDGEEDAKKEG